MIRRALQSVFIILLFFSSATIIAHPHEFALFAKYRTFLNKSNQRTKEYFYFKTACDKKFVALTLDDGPDSNTKLVTKLLQSKHIPATFFLICNNLNAKNVKLYRNSLFEVGMHGFKHADYRKLTSVEIKNAVKNSMRKFKKFNLPLKYFRPPYGIINTALVKTLNQQHIKGILWNIDSFDWNHYRGKKLVNRITNNLTNGSIILLHDRVNPNELTSIIDHIQQQGFTIVPLRTILQYKQVYPR